MCSHAENQHIFEKKGERGVSTTFNKFLCADCFLNSKRVHLSWINFILEAKFHPELRALWSQSLGKDWFGSRAQWTVCLSGLRSSPEKDCSDVECLPD